jgi:hypothetical protein
LSRGRNLAARVDEAVRPLANDPRITFFVGKLDKALDEGTARGWTIVDMKQHWTKVFAFEP